MNESREKTSNQKAIATNSKKQTALLALQTWHSVPID